MQGRISTRLRVPFRVRSADASLVIGEEHLASILSPQSTPIVSLPVIDSLDFSLLLLNDMILSQTTSQVYS